MALDPSCQLLSTAASSRDTRAFAVLGLPRQPAKPEQENTTLLACEMQEEPWSI